VNVRPVNLVPRRRCERPGPAPGGQVLTQRKSQAPPEPLSTHSSIQILTNENSLPDVRAYWSVGSHAGAISGVLFLTVEAEHRTGDFDHTATFTISGTPTAVDRVLLALRAAYAAQIEPPLGE
jgi:hypothetical protein